MIRYGQKLKEVFDPVWRDEYLTRIQPADNRETVRRLGHE